MRKTRSTGFPAWIRLRMAAGGIGDIRLRANLSPISGEYVMVGRSTYVPAAARVSEELHGCWLIVAPKLMAPAIWYWLITDETSRKTGASP
jgi:hypothetical protein